MRGKGKLMVRINTRPEIIPLGAAEKVTLTRSASTPHIYHITVKLESPVVRPGFGIKESTIVCTCKGFINHKKCFHATAMADEFEKVCGTCEGSGLNPENEEELCPTCQI